MSFWWPTALTNVIGIPSALHQNFIRYTVYYECPSEVCCPQNSLGKYIHSRVSPRSPTAFQLWLIITWVVVSLEASSTSLQIPRRIPKHMTRTVHYPCVAGRWRMQCRGCTAASRAATTGTLGCRTSHHRPPAPSPDARGGRRDGKVGGSSGSLSCEQLFLGSSTWWCLCRA